jgi:predicted metal-dependent HD superfamily phosphohydrolase
VLVDPTWPLPHRTDLRDRLKAAYDDPARGYHDLTHLAEVLARLAELGGGDDPEVVLAAWFHDAVYDGHDDDEERSALLAEAELVGEAFDAAQAPPVDAAEVARLVRLTAGHRPAPGDTRGAVLSDADLAVLAAPEERYAEYVAGVRREYAAVPDAEFARGRAAVLADLLAKPTLFHTPYALVHWEDRARGNLLRELRRLRGG